MGCLSLEAAAGPVIGLLAYTCDLGTYGKPVPSAVVCGKTGREGPGEKAQEPLRGECWEATESVNTHPLEGDTCTQPPPLQGNTPGHPSPGACQGTRAPRGTLLAEKEAVREEAFLLRCHPQGRASRGCSRARRLAEGRRASGCPGLQAVLPRAPGPNHKDFNGVSPDPSLPLGWGCAAAGLRV